MLPFFVSYHISYSNGFDLYTSFHPEDSEISYSGIGLMPKRDDEVTVYQSDDSVYASAKIIKMEHGESRSGKFILAYLNLTSDAQYILDDDNSVGDHSITIGDVIGYKEWQHIREGLEMSNS